MWRQSHVLVEQWASSLLGVRQKVISKETKLQSHCPYWLWTGRSSNRLAIARVQASPFSRWAPKWEKTQPPTLLNRQLMTCCVVALSFCVKTSPKKTFNFHCFHQLVSLSPLSLCSPSPNLLEIVFNAPVPELWRAKLYSAVLGAA